MFSTGRYFLKQIYEEKKMHSPDRLKMFNWDCNELFARRTGANPSRKASKSDVVRSPLQHDKSDPFLLGDIFFFSTLEHCNIVEDRAGEDFVFRKSAVDGEFDTAKKVNVNRNENAPSLIQ
uniref:Uncharacterized protein n=1 Tax=Romanomermis culicivorax TaxID=13658 RepID=A0A915L483_ROMCU